MRNKTKNFMLNKKMCMRCLECVVFIQDYDIKHIGRSM